MRAQPQKRQRQHRRMKRPHRKRNQPAQPSPQLLRRRTGSLHTPPRLKQPEQEQQTENHLPVRVRGDWMDGADEDERKRDEAGNGHRGLLVGRC